MDEVILHSRMQRVDMVGEAVDTKAVRSKSAHQLKTQVSNFICESEQRPLAPYLALRLTISNLDS